ncbi:TonB-dependent receptor family protein [Hyphomicrobium sp.]|uniref:TonB-dependent receptor family protein n=1 Tax=Hyphomicrobium sp. TaxID=82 RepID=UPI002E331441|nr:TonB-dependent receptor [Hyphomicrobium sp.]HEX2841730.1 TonB-dependent receptor [Hyphomicrobium sp.]
MQIQKRRAGRAFWMASVACFASTPAFAQQAAAPAQQGLPEVQVIQKKSPVAKKTPAATVSSPAPQPPPVQSEPAAVAEELENAPYGATASGGAVSRAASGSLSPINARQMLPEDLQDLAGSGSRVTTADIEEFRPQTGNEALARVPGVVTVNDDGFARHGGISVRGSAHRRSRKVLVMEDGVPINFSTYLDSSTHYTPPIERVESIEVFRGPVVNYGPLNNHGVVNFRNLSPFGENETLIKAGIGHTEGSNLDVNNFRHVHTRQNFGNAGVVVSYSGADAGGAWDVEELGYNDFYGAIGLRGSKQDLTISGGFFRQRDVYDEDNIEDQDDLFRFGHNKTAAAAAGALDEDATCCRDRASYNADYYRLQLAHNLYIDDNTTLTTRLYGNDHERARFYAADGDSLADVVMEGRDRRYRNYGADSRVEFANLPLFGGMTHTLQAGIRYEEHFFTNQNREGDPGQILTFGNRGPKDGLPQKLEADAFAAFVQTAVSVTPSLTVTPGLRFESYEIEFRDLDEPEFNGGADYDHVLPGIGFAWKALPRSTVYGGYHRGITPHIIRDVQEAAEDVGAFVPPPEEIGDNFEIGVRSTAVRGVTLDLAYFHSRIDNYQFGESFQSAGGDRVFSALDEVTLQGFEIYGRLDSQPFTGGPWNFFGEAVYTYVDSEINKGVNEDEDSVAGNRVPESMRHFANLTLGVAYKQLWDASVTWNYRGDYHTDVDNSSYADEGLVPDVWLLSARTNYKLTENLTLWASGQNLTDELYITDRSDGVKPGVGRTLWAGFEVKF